MEKVSSFLKGQYVILIVIALLMVINYETGLLTPGSLGGDKAAEFPVLAIMELVTVGIIPLALYLFRIPAVSRALMDKPEESLRKWGLVRILMIGLTMVVNTLFYYLFMNASFGYMAIIAAICMLFVYPSLGRCKEETTPENDNENDNENLQL